MFVLVRKNQQILCLKFGLFQVVPHITDAIKDWIESVSLIPVDGKEGQADVCVIELGGTVGKSLRAIGFFDISYLLSKLLTWKYFFFVVAAAYDR